MGEDKKPKTWTFYVDMDGVVADFMAAVIELVYDESAVAPILRGWPKGTYGMGDAIGKSEERIWYAVGREGADFWRELKKYPWASQLVSRLQELGDVIFLSSPSRDPHAATGKLQWIEENFPSESRDYILTPSDHKWRVASPTGILIDDSQDNIDDWNEHGGIGIIFPQPWNDAEQPKDILEHVMSRVREAIGSDDE